MNRNRTTVYEKMQLPIETANADYAQLADELFMSSGEILTENTGMFLKLSSLSTLQESTKELYPAITQIFAFLVSADKQISLKNRVQSNG